MKNFVCITLLAFTIVSVATAQQYFNVIAVDGLFMRSAPNSEAKKLYKFLLGEELSIVDSNNINVRTYKFSIDDSNSWFHVKNHEGLKGYVYGYYLSPKFYPPNPPYHDDEYGSRNTTISTATCTVVIPNYQNDGWTQNKDTTYIGEAVFNEIGDKVVYVLPNDSEAVVKVEYTCLEELNPWGAMDSNGLPVAMWKHHEPFEEIQPIHSYFFPIPITQYDSIRENTAKRLNLKRSPDWDYVGEGWWVPRYIFHHTIVPYQITNVLIRISLSYPNGQESVEILKIGLSYGC